jgi:hypothetical protein
VIPFQWSDAIWGLNGGAFADGVEQAQRSSSGLTR